MDREERVSTVRSPIQGSLSHPTAAMHEMVTINNKVTGEIDMLFPEGKQQ
jgi:hypothetical protein